jgi:hypothetical protein
MYYVEKSVFEGLIWVEKIGYGDVNSFGSGKGPIVTSS